MAVAVRNPGSFRDPSGFVFSRDGVVYRQVSPSFAAHYAHLMSSGLYEQLVDRGWLIPHEELDLRLAYSPAAQHLLLPAQLGFVSQPHEWCFEQWKDAALTTLRVQQLALRSGMILKDANAHNIQMHAARMTLIDSLSLEVFVPGQPWAAYRQFCRHFLAPLALMAKVDARLGQLFRTYVDGIPLDLAARLLPFRSILTWGLGLHIHAHARMERRYAGRELATGTTARSFSQRSMQVLVEHLERTVESLALPRRRTEWDDYYGGNNNYGDRGIAAKVAGVRDLLRLERGDVVWDFGANDGRFSRLARECGATTVVAWDNDVNCVADAYRRVLSEKTVGLYPLVLDLTNPSPATGWANQERASLLNRGPAEVVLALGILHHLAISHGIPFSHIAAFLRRAGRQVIIEWVPKSDSQVQKLLANRPDIFPEYDQSHFEAEFAREFRLIRQIPLEGTCRVLYLMKSRADSAHDGMSAIRG